MQPDVHRSGVILVAAVMQFRRKLLASGKAAIHADQFHQIDDGSFPIQFLGVFGGQSVKNDGHIHDLDCGVGVLGVLAAGAPAAEAGAAAACVPALGGAADVLDAASVGAGAWPKIFDIRLLNNPIIFSF